MKQLAYDGQECAKDVLLGALHALPFCGCAPSIRDYSVTFVEALKSPAGNGLVSAVVVFVMSDASAQSDTVLREAGEEINELDDF